MPNFEQEEPNPEETGFKVEIKTGRPTEEDFKQRVENYLFPLENGIPMQYFETKMELENFTEGEGDQDLRKQFYPDWTDEDFKEVLKRLNEKEPEILKRLQEKKKK